MNLELLNFSEQINRHGYAITITAVKNDIQSTIIGSMTPIQIVTSGQSLYAYLENLVDKIHPDKIIIVAKQKNGQSFKNPKTFVYRKPIKEQEPVETMLNGFPSISSNNSSNPMAQVYQFQIATLNSELAKITKDRDKHESKHEKFKEKYYECKKELELIEDKHQLNLERNKIEQENTLSGVLKEFKPEIQATLSGIADKFGDNSKEIDTKQLNGAGVDPETKLGLMLTVFNSLQDETLSIYFEVISRLGQIDLEQKNQLLNKLRDLTPDFNEQFESINQLKTK